MGAEGPMPWLPGLDAASLRVVHELAERERVDWSSTAVVVENGFGVTYWSPGNEPNRFVRFGIRSRNPNRPG